jgi:hypothetical protein
MKSDDLFGSFAASKARRTDQRQQATRRACGLAGEPQYRREHHRRQRIRDRTAAGMIVGGSAISLTNRNETIEHIYEVYRY